MDNRMIIIKNEGLRDPWKEPFFGKGEYTNREMTEKERIEWEENKKRQQEIDKILRDL